MKSITLDQVAQIIHQIKQDARKQKEKSLQVSTLMDGVGIGLDTLVTELNELISTKEKEKEKKDVAESDKPSKSKNKKS
jgi:hypothetical protein